jgi:glycosyltransferase involved in cell wall biosynthesis
MIDLANAFHEAGYQVHLITGKLKPRNSLLYDEIVRHKVSPYNRGSSNKRIVSWFLATWQMFWISKFKLKGAHLLIVSNPPLAPLLPLILNIKFDLLIYDIYPDALHEMNVLGSHNLIVRFWEKLNVKVFRKADRILTLTEGMKSVLTKYAGKKEIEVVPIWTDNQFLKPVPKNDNPFISKFHLQDKFVVMYSGNLGKSHDVDVIPEIASKINNPKVIFIIIGDGDQKKGLEEQISKLKLTNLMMLPYQPASDLPFTLSAADIAIVTLGKNASNLSVPSKTYNLMSVGAAILSIADEDSELASLTKRFAFGETFRKDQLNEIISFINNTAANLELQTAFKTNSLKASTYFDKSVNCKRIVEN